MTRVQSPIDVEKWIEENAEKFKPPVSNRYLYDGRDFFVMVVKGPNARNDFHLVDSEEYFYQLKATLRCGLAKAIASLITLSVRAKRFSFRRTCRIRLSVRRTRLGWL